MLTQIDSFLSDLWPRIVARQLAYKDSPYLVQTTDQYGDVVTDYRVRGVYWQGLISHSVYPDDGNVISADRLTTHPTDQKESWNDVLANDPPAKWPSALVVDTYDSPQGKGFVVTAYVAVSGKVFSRSRNYGPETFRTVSWHEVTES